MIRLTVHNRKTNNRKVYELNQNTVVFGRAANCDVVLDSEFVSRRHAQLVIKRNLVELEDLGSGNGTLVNQKKLDQRERVPLKKGDKIRVEEFVIDVEAEEETYVGPESRLKADKFEITDPDIIEIKMIKKILGAFDSDKRPCVVVVSAPFQHLRAFIEDDASAGEGREFAVGRDPKCQLVIDDATVSRRHAVITRKWGAFAIKDLGSKNGTFVNGEKIREKTVSDGDEIVFGTVKAVFKNPEEFNLDAISKSIAGDAKIVDKVKDAAELTRAENEKAKRAADAVPASVMAPPTANKKAEVAGTTKPAAPASHAPARESPPPSKPQKPEPEKKSPAITPPPVGEGASGKSVGAKPSQGLLRQLSAMEIIILLFGLGVLGFIVWALRALFK